MNKSLLKSIKRTSMLFVIMAMAFSFQALALDCNSPIPSNSMCVAPTSFDYRTVQDGSWNNPDTWLNGNVPQAEKNSNENIRISHDVYLSQGNIKLQENTVLFVVGTSSSLTIKNGNLYLEGADSRAIVQNGILRTSGNIEQKENTFLCMKFVELSVGEEEAGLDFVDGSSSTSANFKNDGGYRWLERVCANITGDYQNLGDDYIIDSAIDIGDKGNADRDLDGSDSGDLKNEYGAMYVRNSEFYIPNGDFLNSASFEACGADFRINNGNAQNNSNGQLDAENIVFWLSNGNIQNDGSWDGSSIKSWANDGGSAPQGIDNLPNSSDSATIASLFTGCIPIILGPPERVGVIPGRTESIVTVNIWPNPIIEDYIKVRVNNTNGSKTQVHLFNIQGSLIYKTTTDSNDISIPAGNLNSGTYLLSVKHENKTVNKIMVK